MVDAGDYLASLHTLRPAVEYHEDYGTVLWWRLPIEEPPYVGSPLNTDWDDMMICGQSRAEYYTHWLPLPDCRMLRTSDGAEITSAYQHLQLPLPVFSVVQTSSAHSVCSALRDITKRLNQLIEVAEKREVPSE